MAQYLVQPYAEIPAALTNLGGAMIQPGIVVYSAHSLRSDDRQMSFVAVQEARAILPILP